MNSSEAIETLRRSERALRDRGVMHAALFGSLARSDTRPNSDIDIMIEIDPDPRMTVFEYVDIKDYIGTLFDKPVDVVTREGLKPRVSRPRRLMRLMRSERPRSSPRQPARP
jgi:predicted nucleotidyltransferase